MPRQLGFAITGIDCGYNDWRVCWQPLCQLSDEKNIEDYENKYSR